MNTSPTCALQQTNFTGDLPMEDNETDQGRSERGEGASYKGPNEVGGGVEGLSAGPLGWQRDAKHHAFC